MFLRIGGSALADLLPDVRSMPRPAYTALADAISSLVLDGRITTETRLPSERELATALGMSRATVTAAYDALRSSAFVVSRTGAGSFVALPPGARARSALNHWPPVGPDGIEVLDLSCATLEAPPEVITQALAAVTEQLGPYLATNGYEPAGLPVLREAVAARFTARGVPTRADQVLITSGAQHGLDLVLRLLLGPGDRVVTELPTYPGVLDAVRAYGGRVIPVPVAPAGGWQPDLMSASLRQTAARLAYLIPDFHNPTGALVPAADRRAVLRTARRTGTTVVVDESFVDLAFETGERPTAALDPSVVTLGSLSKPIWGGLRIGWVRGSADLMNRLAALRASIDMSGAVLEQLVACTLLERVDEIAADRIRELSSGRDTLLTALRQHLPSWRPTLPSGGLSLWCELDAALSTPLTMLAAHAGVMVLPGSRFGVDGTLERFIRLPYTLPPHQLTEAVRRIAGVWAGLAERAAPAGLAARPRVVA